MLELVFAQYGHKLHGVVPGIFCCLRNYPTPSGLEQQLFYLFHHEGTQCHLAGNWDGPAGLRRPHCGTWHLVRDCWGLGSSGSLFTYSLGLSTSLPGGVTQFLPQWLRTPGRICSAHKGRSRMGTVWFPSFFPCPSAHKLGWIRGRGKNFFQLRGVCFPFTTEVKENEHQEKSA